MSDFIILTINPGSTSTKISLFSNEEEIFSSNLKHSFKEISKYKRVTDQYYFRREIILDSLKNSKIDLNSIDCIVGRGGLIRHIPSGVYSINQQMIKDLKSNLSGEHPCNLGGILAKDIAKDFPNIQTFIADPVVVDELQDIARLSGHPKIERHSIFHALNQKAIARNYASDIGKKYEELNLIVVHLGGGISIGVHKEGRVIDVNDGLNGEGPYTPERSGGLTAKNIVSLCFTGEYTQDDIKRMITGEGGLAAYLGTNNVKTVLKRIKKGDNYAKTILNGMSYQVSKEIGAMATVLKGNIDAIILTGGIAYSSEVTDFITDHVKYLAPVKIYPGEDEMLALAQNGLRVLRKEVEPLEY